MFRRWFLGIEKTHLSHNWERQVEPVNGANYFADAVGDAKMNAGTMDSWVVLPYVASLRLGFLLQRRKTSHSIPNANSVPVLNEFESGQGPNKLHSTHSEANNW
jgi:hypothetical protein